MRQIQFQLGWDLGRFGLSDPLSTAKWEPHPLVAEGTRQDGDNLEGDLAEEGAQRGPNFGHLF